MIYIDPPYNTGKEFVYPDKFQDNLDTYLKYTGQKDDEGLKFSSNTETGGRKHTNWLNMMYPRLKLAKSLLRQDGVIFISIDDNEQSNLKEVCDEIFGAENFVAQLVWSNKEGGGSSDSSYFRIKHEYILCYAKNLTEVEIIGVPINNRDRYTQSDDYVSERGPYYLQKLGMGSIQYSESLDYDIETPDGTTVRPKDNNKGKQACWRWSQTKYKWGKENGFIEIKKDSSDIWTVYTKQYLNCDNEGNVIERTQRPFGVIDTFSSTQASKSLDALDMATLFDYTKPTTLMAHLIQRIIKDEGIVLDFFAGSSSTAHAIIELNIQDKNINYIMVQLPEKIEDQKAAAYKAGFKTIAEISKERIRRAAKKIKDENPDYNGDLGFKVFKLASSNIKIWNPDRTDLETSLLEHQEHLVEGRTEQDVLYELLLKRGVDLTTPIETKQIAGKNVYSIGYGKIITCLDDLITNDQVEELAAGVIAWQKELKQTLGVKVLETHVFFKDSAFRDDVAKTNMAAIFSQNGIDHVRSL